MVYYFTSKAVDPAAFIYVGKDKFESAFLPGCVKAGWGFASPTSSRLWKKERVRC